MRSLIIYVFLFSLLGQLQLAVADAHVLHQSVGSHINFDASSPDAVSDIPPRADKAPSKFDFDRDCNHCCHCQDQNSVALILPKTQFSIHTFSQHLTWLKVDNTILFAESNYRPPIL